jgi:hypothetical protein
MSLLATVRQWRFAKEFRISVPVWPEGALAVLEKLDVRRPEADPVGLKDQERLLADLGTGLWRIRQRMIEPETGKPLEEMKRAFRHLQATWDILADAGIEIQDHTGVLFDSGMSIKVLAFQPMADIDRETVIETIRPTVYFRSQRIQMGEVIVGRPPSPDASASSE